MAPTAETSVQDKCILVVDDEPAVLKMLGLVLTRQGCRVRQALTGVQALELYRRYQGDIGVILLDVRMGPMDGLETLAQLRLLDLRVPVCFMTGHGGKYTDSELLASGATHVFSKPFNNLDELTRLLHDAAQLPAAGA